MKKFKRVLALLLSTVMAVGALAGCGGTSDNGDITLIWYFLGDTTKADNDEVFQMASDMVYEKLGFRVDFRPVDYSSYDEKVKMIIAGGEDYDICWTSNWKNDYATNVANGAFLPLDDLLDEVPALKNSIVDKIWSGTKIGGQIYGVPSQQIMARSTAFSIPTEFYEKYNEELEGVESFMDLDAYMKAFGTDNPNVGVVSMNWQNLCYDLGFDDVISNGFPCSVALEGDANEITVVNPYESDIYKEAIELVKTWKDAGYIVKGRDGAASGSLKRPVDEPFTVASYKPGIEVSDSASRGYSVTYIRASEPYLTSSGINATLNAINSRSEHPVEALKFLEYLNTDKELMNLLVYGIEGRHYEKIDDVTVKRFENPTFKNDAWVIGNVFNTYVLEGQSPDTHKLTKEINDGAKTSRLLGFTPDLEDIQLEIANCTSVITEYKERVEYGETQLLDEMNAKFKEAGLDTIITEMQTQIDAWLATK